MCLNAHIQELANLITFATLFNNLEIGYWGSLSEKGDLENHQSFQHYTYSKHCSIRIDHKVSLYIWDLV